MAVTFGSILDDTFRIFKQSYNLGKWFATFTKFSPNGHDFKKLSRLEVNLIKSKAKPIQYMIDQNIGGIAHSRGDLTLISDKMLSEINKSNNVLKKSLPRLKSFEKLLTKNQLSLLSKACNAQVISYRILTDNRRVFMEAFRGGDLVNSDIMTTYADSDVKQMASSKLLIQIIYYLLTLRLMLSSSMIRLVDVSMTLMEDGDLTRTLDFTNLNKLAGFDDIMFNSKELTRFIKKHTKSKESKSFGQFLHYSIDIRYYKTIMGILRRHSELANLDYNNKTDKLLNFLASKGNKGLGVNIKYGDINKLLESEEFKNFDNEKFVTENLSEEEIEAINEDFGLLGLGALSFNMGGLGLGALGGPLGAILLGIFGIFAIKYAIHFFFHVWDWIEQVFDDLDSLDALLQVRQKDRRTKALIEAKVQQINNNVINKLKKVENETDLRREIPSNSEMQKIDQAENVSDKTIDDDPMANDSIYGNQDNLDSGGLTL